MVQIPTTPAEIIPFIIAVITSHAFIEIIIFPGFLHLTLITAFLTWYERKLLARIQLRIGPLYAGGPGGILQPIADGVKLIFKEVILPYRADSALFLTVPLALVFLAALPFAVIPFGQNWVIANLDVGISVRLCEYSDVSAHDNPLRMGQQQQVSFPRRFAFTIPTGGI